jgi:hypothetical protein
MSATSLVEAVLTLLPDPILPFEIFNRTTVVGYLTTFIHGVAVMAVVYFLPAWFIAVKGHSSVRAGIDLFPVSFLIAPFAIVSVKSQQPAQHVCFTD